MAQRIDIVLIDDLDGTEAHETVSFALDGTAYEIDLSKENAETLRVSLDLYVSSARKVSGKRGRRTGTKSRVDSKAVRQWAQEQGMSVSSRGTLSAEIVQAYEAAH